MRLRLRLLWLLLSSFWKKPLGLLDESVLDLRVLPNDIDITKATSDRYSALMDLGRIDYACRCGLRNAMFKKNWIPVATFITIRFRYPLKIFQKYQLKTRLIWWDERTFYFEQIFERNGRVVTTGHMGAILFNKNGQIPSSVVIKESGQSISKPKESEVIAKLREIEILIHETQKD
jgi:acyl-CoA thioesterase FadM